MPTLLTAAAARRLRPAVDVRDAALCGLLALLVYVLLGQRTFYKIDGHLYLALVLDGERSYPRHFLYLPMVHAARDLLAPLGLTLYEAARLLSALGTATGMALLHLASRGLGLERRAALLATATCATMPHVVFFATVVEVHGPFLAFSGLAAVAAAALTRRPSVGRAATFGATCALAFCAHSTAALLPALLLPLILLYPPRPFARGLLPGAVTAATLAAGIALSPFVARLVGVEFDLHHSGAFATDRATTNFGAAWRYGHTLLYEWLIPMLPLSVLTPCGLLGRRLRAQTGWLLLGAIIYLACALMILGGEAEWGAYLLPFCWPLALWALRALPVRGVLLVLALQAGTAVWLVRRHDDPRRTLAYAQGARELADGAPLALLAGDDIDLQAYLLHLTDAERLPLFELARLPATAVADAGAALRHRIDDLLARGCAVLLSDAARARVVAVPAATPCGSGLLALLERSYRCTPAAREGFTGTRLFR